MKIQAQQCEVIAKQPDKDCPKCKGKGHYSGLKCICIIGGFTDWKPVIVNLVIKPE